MSMIGNFLSVTEAELNQYIDDSGLLIDRVSDIDSESQNWIDIDKSWQAIHYILTKDPWEGRVPESLVVLGGVEIGDDLGYGPGKYITPSEVKIVAAILKNLNHEKIRSEYDPEAYEEMEIYPSGIWQEEKMEAIEYVLSYLEPLSKFYERAAKEGLAVIKYINQLILGNFIVNHGGNID